MALTAREFALVAYLGLHRGRVVTRTELYEHLFDEGDDTLSNLLEVHVCNLRRKLEAARPDSDPIRSVYGVGYAWEGWGGG